MRWITSQIKWIMLAAGVLTCTMAMAAIAPQAALMTTFGETLEGPVAEIVVRNWGALITLIGGMLIYGAYSPVNRGLVVVVAGLSKVIFIGLILAFGSHFLSRAGLAIAVDSIIIFLFAVYLFATRKETASA